MAWISLDLQATRRIDAAFAANTPRGLMHPDRTVAFHDMVFIRAGSWEIWEEGLCYFLEPGDLLILVAGRHHYARIACAPRTAWSYIHFSSAPDDRYLEAAHPSGSATTVVVPNHIHAAKRPMVGHAIQRIIATWASALAGERLRARLLLSELLIDLASQSLAMPVVDERIVELIRFLEEHPSAPHRLDALADRAGLGRRDLSRRFRHATGTSLKQFHLQMRIRIACGLLAQFRGMRLREIADQLGFHDEFHFSRAFRSQLGMPPQAWRTREFHDQDSTEMA
jgi:AraC-like DNA-binding protein